MNYEIVDARFQFWNGKQQFTVEYAYGISMWFIFNNQEYRDCIYKKVDKKIKLRDVNYFSAKEVFEEYLDSLKQN